MRAYLARYGGGLESLCMQDVDDPGCGAGHVLVDVRAVSLNFRDIMILRGRYPLPVRDTLVPCCDGAGEVVAIGEGVTDPALGDRVMLAIFPRWIGGPFRFDRADQIGGSLNGTLAERISVDADGLAHIPEHLSYEEAAALPCAALTAWNALTGGERLLPGSTVLTMGSGGVSLAALQFAKLLGACVVATTSSDRRAAVLRALGADEVINYRKQPQWAGAVRSCTGGQGCDVIVELGGTGTLEQSMQCLKPDGTLALVGSLAAQPDTLDPALLAGVFRMRRIAVGNVLQFHEMARAVDAHRLRPVIDRVFNFTEAPSAFEYFLNRDAIGKVIIVKDVA